MARKSSRRSRRADAARVRPAAPTAWPYYLQRARQTFRAMQYSAEQGDWVAVAAIAPTCAIAAADAVVARIAGVVAGDVDHAAAVALLLAHGGELSGVQRAANHLRRIVERKVEMQYGAERVSESTARSMLDHAERLLAWAESHLERFD